jgi:hypothetical protein
VVGRDGTPLFSQILATSHLQPPCYPVRLFTGASESNGFVKIAYPVWYNKKIAYPVWYNQKIAYPVWYN